jgi:hypothetical protein
VTYSNAKAKDGALPSGKRDALDLELKKRDAWGFVE